MLRYQPDLATRIAVGVKSQGPSEPIKTRALTDLLFEQGMNARYQNWLGITPLHTYAKRNDIENATIFLEHGADINAVDDEFYSTPLGYAARYGKQQMVNFLLKQGADPNLPHQPAWARPLAWATKRGHEEIIALLKQYNAHE